MRCSENGNQQSQKQRAKRLTPRFLTCQIQLQHRKHKGRAKGREFISEIYLAEKNEQFVKKENNNEIKRYKNFTRNVHICCAY